MRSAGDKDHAISRASLIILAAQLIDVFAGLVDVAAGRACPPRRLKCASPPCALLQAYLALRQHPGLKVRAQVARNRIDGLVFSSIPSEKMAAWGFLKDSFASLYEMRGKGV